MAKLNTLMTLTTLSILGIVGILAYMITGGNLKGQTFQTGGGITTCQYTPSVTIDAVNKYTGETVSLPMVWRIKGEKVWHSSTTGTSISANPGDVIEYVIASDSTSYYGVKGTTDSVPCKPEMHVEADVAPIASSVQFQAWNDNGLPNSASEPESLSAGDVKTVKIQFTGEYKKDFGKDYDIVVIAYNRTVFDSVELSGATETSVPVQVNFQSGMAYKAYKIPALRSNNDLKLQMVLDASDTVDPTSSDNIQITLYDSQLYANEKTVPTTYAVGVEDENYNDVGGSNPSFTYYIA